MYPVRVSCEGDSGSSHYCNQLISEKNPLQTDVCDEAIEATFILVSALGFPLLHCHQESHCLLLVTHRAFWIMHLHFHVWNPLYIE